MPFSSPPSPLFDDQASPTARKAWQEITGGYHMRVGFMSLIFPTLLSALVLPPTVIGVTVIGSTRAMIRKILDAIALASVAVLIGVVVWVATWGEGPRSPGHSSMQLKIVAWDTVPFVFGFNWLLGRFVKIAVERSPRLMSQLTKILSGVVLFAVLVLVVGGMILPKLLGE